jgi:uncharacterized protein YecE (DUF72 family)
MGLDWHIGCSGFHYKHWKGTFYPDGLAQKSWFNFYAQHFSTLELNGTFYKFPRLPYLQRWYDLTNAEFKFAVKAPQAITHYRQFHNVTDMISSFYGTIREGLQEKLGPVLFQLPPHTHFQPERLARILDQLDPSFQNVLEFRHESWWRREVYESLAERCVTFCGMSHPDLPDTFPPDAPLIYYRFHGVPELYRSTYTNDALEDFVEKARQLSCVQDVWCYFNNDSAVAAIPNAQLLEKIALSGLPAS